MPCWRKRQIEKLGPPEKIEVQLVAYLGSNWKAAESLASSAKRFCDAAAKKVDSWLPHPFKLADDVSYEAAVHNMDLDASGHNDEIDARRHTRWNQRMVRSMCPGGSNACLYPAAAIAFSASTGHEVLDEFAFTLERAQDGYVQQLAGTQGWLDVRSPGRDR